MTELTLLTWSQISLRLHCYEMLWLYIDKGRLQGISKNFCCNFPKNSLSLEFSISICSLAADDPFLVVSMIQSFTTGFEKLSVPCAPSFNSSPNSLPIQIQLWMLILQAGRLLCLRLSLKHKLLRPQVINNFLKRLYILLLKTHLT